MLGESSSGPDFVRGGRTGRSASASGSRTRRPASGSAD